MGDVERQAKQRRPVAAAMGVVVLLYLAGVNGHWQPTPDSALYLSIGRNLASGLGYRYQGLSMGQTEPVVPLLGAASHRLFGQRHLALNLLYALMGAAAAWMAYCLAHQSQPAIDGPPDDAEPRSDRSIPLACLLAVGLSSRLSLNAHQILTDVPFTLLAACAFWAAGRIATRSAWWAVLAWALLLAATMTRLIGVTLLGALALALILPGGRVGAATIPLRRRRLALIGAGFAAAGLGGWACYASRLPGPQSPGLVRMAEMARSTVGLYLGRIGRALVELPGGVLETFWGEHLPAAGCVALAIMLLGMAMLLRRRQWLLLTPVWCYLATLMLVGPEPYRKPRYLLPMAPWLAIWFFAGSIRLADLVRRKWATSPATATWKRRLTWLAGLVPWKWSRLADSAAVRAAVVALAGVILLTAPAWHKTVRQIYFAHHPDYYRVIDGGKWAGYVKAARWLRRTTNVPAGARVFTDEPRVIHFLTGLPSGDPSPQARMQRRFQPQDWPTLAANGNFDYVLLAGGQRTSPQACDAFAGDKRFQPVYRNGSRPGKLDGSAARGWFEVLRRRTNPPASQAGPGLREEDL